MIKTVHDNAMEAYEGRAIASRADKAISPSPQSISFSLASFCGFTNPASTPPCRGRRGLGGGIGLIEG